MYFLVVVNLLFITSIFKSKYSL